MKEEQKEKKKFTWIPWEKRFRETFFARRFDSGKRQRSFWRRRHVRIVSIVPSRRCRKRPCPTSCGFRTLKLTDRRSRAVYLRKKIHKNIVIFFKKMGHPWPLSHWILSFQTNIIAIFTTNICEKCPSSLWCQDSKPQSLERESLPITTRPGLPPIQYNCWIIIFLKTDNDRWWWMLFNCNLLLY